MNFLSTIKLILELLPIIINTVKQLEEAFPESGKGSLKIALVKQSLASVHEVSNDVLPLIETIINSVVVVFNEFGVFAGSTSKQ